MHCHASPQKAKHRDLLTAACKLAFAPPSLRYARFISVHANVRLVQVGRSFTPLDAVALATKAVLQTDLRRTSRKIVHWLDTYS